MSESPRQDLLCTAAQAAEATGGEVLQGAPGAGCTGISTDSRHLSPGAMFVALRGENFDGARFCRQAVEGGARLVLVPRVSWEQGGAGPLPSEVAVICVPDALRALGDLAAWHRRRFSVRLVAITGSNGKTSTKLMAVAVLGGGAQVLLNRGNLNNLVGMPRALLELRETHRHAVMEMGMNAPGEIRRLAEIAAPQVGAITNVHPAHLQGLGSLQAVADAKGELFESLPADATALVNVDDPYVLRVAGRTSARQCTFGRSPSAEVRLLTVRSEGPGLALEIDLAGQRVATRIQRPGLHNALNATLAAAVGLAEGVAAEAIATRLAAAVFPPLRLEPLRVGCGHLLVDCYNANPRSMQAALQALQEVAGEAPRYALLGEMRELGTASAELHRQVGAAAAESGLQSLCVLGELAEPLTAGARDAGLASITQAASPDAAIAWVEAGLAVGAWILVKGSRGMRLERIVEAVAQRAGVDWSWVHEE